jgi:release factor glutamine methyltransferase
LPSLQELLAAATERLTAAGVPSPRADAELLAGHVLALGRGEVAARAFAGASMSADEAEAFEAFVVRRAAREPLQHLTGVAYFRALTLSIGPGAFVPRPETEMVAQLAIDALLAVPSAEPTAVDLGTGSGAIAIALATEVPQARVYGVELSPDAFVWAKLNARNSGAENLQLVLGDFAHALPELDGTVDVLVSNPPYIPVDAVPRDPEVRFHDPELALYGGSDGLDLVRSISRRALVLVRPGGALVLEHAEVQGEAVRALLTADGWRAAATHPDLLGRPRATTATR